MPYGPGHNSAFLVACALWAGDRAAAYKYVKAPFFDVVPGFGLGFRGIEKLPPAPRALCWAIAPRTL